MVTRKHKAGPGVLEAVEQSVCAPRFKRLRELPLLLRAFGARLCLARIGFTIYVSGTGSSIVLRHVKDPVKWRQRLDRAWQIWKGTCDQLGEGVTR